MIYKLKIFNSQWLILIHFSVPTSCTHGCLQLYESQRGLNQRERFVPQCQGKEAELNLNCVYGQFHKDDSTG